MSVEVKVGRFGFDLGRAVIAAGCVYELAALHRRSPLPTISELVNKLRSHNWLWVAALVWDILWDDHFGIKVAKRL